MAKKEPAPRSARYWGMRSAPSMGEGGTWLEPEEVCYPGGAMVRRCRAVCPDGALRVVLCGVPDTYFSIPAVARMRGRRMRGFVSQKGGRFLFTPYTPELAREMGLREDTPGGIVHDAALDAGIIRE